MRHRQRHAAVSGKGACVSEECGRGARASPDKTGLARKPPLVCAHARVERALLLPNWAGVKARRLQAPQRGKTGIRTRQHSAHCLRSRCWVVGLFVCSGAFFLFVCFLRSARLIINRRRYNNDYFLSLAWNHLVPRELLGRCAERMLASGCAVNVFRTPRHATERFGPVFRVFLFPVLLTCAMGACAFYKT